MTDWLYQGDFGTVPTNVPTALLGLLLAFLCGHVIAWIYMYTHPGLSYSRSFVGSLMLIPVIVSLVMNVLSHNLVTAFGMMAVFAIVRFRNILRDTLDTAYVLAVIVIGLACGTQKFATAVIGCAGSAMVLLYIWYTNFGTRHRYNMIVNLHWTRPLSELCDLRQLLRRHSRKSICASQRAVDGGDGADLSYRLLLRDPERMADLLSELKSLHGVSRVSGLQAEDESEL
ncbi:MAG: DUF4956 domain-containing protein [Candidatus Omnitrophica bacterium]|nr:DUF4956 domain-containing protein [Candidatus Omnitrophota bacterium]